MTKGSKGNHAQQFYQESESEHPAIVGVGSKEEQPFRQQGGCRFEGKLGLVLL